jgi:hypothetical protein
LLGAELLLALAGVALGETSYIAADGFSIDLGVVRKVCLPSGLTESARIIAVSTLSDDASNWPEPLGRRLDHRRNDRRGLTDQSVAI